jgi:hypothetical protein
MFTNRKRKWSVHKYLFKTGHLFIIVNDEDLRRNIQLFQKEYFETIST